MKKILPRSDYVQIFEYYAQVHIYTFRHIFSRGIAVEILSVCPSVKRVYCDKTKAPSEEIQL